VTVCRNETGRSSRAPRLPERDGAPEQGAPFAFSGTADGCRDLLLRGPVPSQAAFRCAPLPAPITMFRIQYSTIAARMPLSAAMPGEYLAANEAPT
jgi:hypothetical protein